MLKSLSNNPNKIYGVYLTNNDTTFVMTNEITQPYNAGQKTVVGITPTIPIIIDPIGTQTIPDSHTYPDYNVNVI
jgi:hypothetical protein